MTTAVHRSCRRLAAGLLVALLGAAPAHAQEVGSTGMTRASVTLAMAADVPSVVRLQLAADRLVFDLGVDLGSDGLACVVATAANVASPSEDGRVAPAGTTFRLGAWPDIDVVGGTALMSYPPPASTSGGVVCYRTFLLEAFANTAGWQLSAGRSDRSLTAPFPPLYLEAVCRGDAPLGLRAIESGGTLALVTDKAPGGCGEVLVAAAVRIDGQAAGETVTDVLYTLVSADTDFGAAMEDSP